MKPVPRVLLQLAIIAACVLVAWLLAGRYFSMVLDRAWTVEGATLPTRPLVYTDGVFWIAGVPMAFTRPGGGGSDLRAQLESSNRLVLSVEGKSYILGPVSSSQGPDGVEGIAFGPDVGDEVTFTSRRSMLSWPTPFEFNFMTGQSSSWRRHVYYRLRWRKPSGAQLDMLWRYEQWFYGNLGWASGMMTGPATGLIRVEIRQGK